MKKAIYNGIRYAIYRVKSRGYGKSKVSKYLMALIRPPNPSLSSLISLLDTLDILDIHEK